MASISERQERRKQRTRSAIQRAALDLFARDGFRATTIQAIADAADVAPRTVTLHFPAKEDLLFAADPFAVRSLAGRLAERRAGEDALTALREWMVTTMSALEGEDDSIWQRRRLRAQVIAADDSLRGRARAGYFEYERALAEAIAADLGAPSDALVPRVAATSAIAGLRELYETPEATNDYASLVALVDQVLAFVRAGISASR